MIARLEPIKGHIHFLKAIAIVIQANAAGKGFDRGRRLFKTRTKRFSPKT